jgi:hypothetical protein
MTARKKGVASMAVARNPVTLALAYAKVDARVDPSIAAMATASGKTDDSP